MSDEIIEETTEEVVETPATETPAEAEEEVTETTEEAAAE